MGETLENEELWREVLAGEHSDIQRGRRLYKHVPSSPRCKMCNAPFAGVGAPFMRLIGRRPSGYNPKFCGLCEKFVRQHPGGVEIELTMLFADLRGSTPLAEKLGTAAFTQLINRFFVTATNVLIDVDALISRLVGDEVVALFLPAFAGQNHPTRAVAGATELLKATGNDGAGEPWAPIGIGLHTGRAWVGSVGGGGAGKVVDFTALGDEVNLTARLASSAGAGEVLLTDATRSAAGLETTGLERRELEVKGKTQPVDVWVLRAGAPATEPAQLGTAS